MRISSDGKGYVITKKFAITIPIVFILITVATWVVASDSTQNEKIIAISDDINELKDDIVPRAELEAQFQHINNNLDYIIERLDTLG